MTSKMLNGLVSPKTDIRICLNSKRRFYSTLDRIEGHVTFTPAADLAFDDIDIEFVGTSRTYVERLTTAAAISGRSQAFHQFLRLSQPGLPAYYPDDRILKAGQTYKIPFVFAVPAQLLPKVCGHAAVNETIRDTHLQLPPSLGDCEPGSKEQPNDFAPEMASIRYGVYAKISRNKLEKNDVVKRTTVCSKARKLRIVPAYEEQPPLNVDENPDFSLRKEKKLRKGLLKGKIGTLVMESQQPSAFVLPPSDSEHDGRTVTMATIHMRFDPLEAGAKPPKLSNLTSKLKINTFYGTAARHDFPLRSTAVHDFSTGFHSESLEISSRCMANVEWERMESERCASPAFDTAPRRTSSNVSGPIIPPEASTTYTGGAFYVARILVPIELPSSKTFVPTFHSCLISRTYSLSLSLSTNSAFGGNLDLRLPLQIAASASLRNDSPRGSVTSMTSVDVDDDADSSVDDFFEPRTIHAPEEEFVGGSVLRGSLDDAVPETTVRRDSGLEEDGNSGLPEYSLHAPGSRSRGVVPVF